MEAKGRAKAEETEARSATSGALYHKSGAIPAIPKRPTFKRVLVALQEQYQSLLESSPERLRDAKRDGRAAVRKQGLKDSVADLLPARVLRRRSNKSIEKSRQLQARFYEGHKGEAVPCPECVMKCGLPKQFDTSRVGHESGESGSATWRSLDPALSACARCKVDFVL